LRHKETLNFEKRLNHGSCSDHGVMRKATGQTVQIPELDRLYQGQALSLVIGSSNIHPKNGQTARTRILAIAQLSKIHDWRSCQSKCNGSIAGFRHLQ
jgi:hypothetical protein